MNSPEIIALNRARTTFQRVSDAKIFNGWIKQISLDGVVVHTCTSTQPQQGDEYVFQVYGSQQDGCFRGVLSWIRGAESPTFLSERPGSSAAYEIGCKIVGEMTFKDAQGEPRFSVEGMSADVALDEDLVCSGATVIDIGLGGFAVLLDKQFKKGDAVEVSLYANGQLVQFKAEIRNCIGGAQTGDLFRTGLQILDMSRVDALRWKQLYADILNSNRIHGPTRTAQVGSVVKRKSKRAA